MEKELDVALIKATQSSLGKYVKRPPLTEKLLRKPPFRFLHDIVTSVLKTTGFFEGLFDEEELVSDNVKDRENKIAFLNKVITVVGITTGRTLAVKPSKIVAGQEPDKTNELLQCLAQALDNKLSSDEAVKQFKDGSRASKSDEKRSKDPLKQSKKTSEPNKLTSKSSEKLTNNKKESLSRTSHKNDIDKTNSSKTKKEKSSIKTDSPPKKSSQQPTKLVASKKQSIEKKRSESHVDSKENGIEIDPDIGIETLNGKVDPKLEVRRQPQLEKVELPSKEDMQFSEKNNLDSSYTIVDGLNSSLSSQDLMEPENNKGDELDPIDNTLDIAQCDERKAVNDKLDNMVTDSIDDELKEIADQNTSSPVNTKNPEYIDKVEVNANIGTSNVKASDETKTTVRPLSVRPSSSRPGAPRPRDKHDNIIIEADNFLVGKVTIIAESAPNEEEEETSIVIVEQESSMDKSNHEDHEHLNASHNDHGHLVQQILDSQKEFSQMSGKTEIEWQFGAQKARDALNKEIEQLRFDVQALSRVANPLGKVMDHIQEDVEVMRQELNQWAQTYEETSKELSKQKIANEESLLPLYTKVKNLESDIEEKRDKINDLKIVIHKNSHRIDKLLANGIVQ